LGVNDQLFKVGSIIQQQKYFQASLGMAESLAYPAQSLKKLQKIPNI
jgi:hypothetical protein